MRRLLLAGIAVGACVIALPAHAAGQFAPLDRPGPALQVSEAALAQSVHCTEDVTNATRTPVLLIHGTGADSEINWSWNHIPALDDLGIPWCTVDLPVGGSGDLQLNAEYVVYAIREAHRRAGGRIAIIGHSQGGMSPRWAFRFWPDTRGMVSDLIGYAPPNHGSASADLTCQPGQACSPSTYQFRTTSAFNAALNSRTETLAGISYTNVYSHTDFIATPNSNDQGTSSLHVGDGEIANIAIQDICPLQTTEHLGLAYDAVAWALAYDALTHDGPAQESRIAPAVCSQLVMPGVNPVTFAVDVASALAAYAAFPSAPDVTAEPPLQCYVLLTGCSGRAAVDDPLAAADHPIVQMRIVSRRLVVRGRRTAVRVRCAGQDAGCAARLRVIHSGKTLGSTRIRLGAQRTRGFRLALSPPPARQVRSVAVELRRNGASIARKRLSVRVR